MTSVQEAKLNMFNAVIAYCDESTAITASLPAFATDLAAFKSSVENIDETAQLEAQVISGIAINKADLKDGLCNSAETLAAALFAYATAEDNVILQQKANYSMSDFQRLKDDELVIITQNLHDVAVPIVASLENYGVTVGTLADFEDLIEDYNDSVSAPRNAAALRKTYVAQLKTLFKVSDDFLKDRLDKLAIHFKQSQPEFYFTYKNNRRIINAPTSATQAKGIITDSASGLPIFEVNVTVEDQEYSAVSDLEGNYSLKIPVPGIYTLVFSKEGYQTVQSPNVEILLGQATTIDVQMTQLQ